MSYFITGTDTGVGKTYVTCLLLRLLNASGRRALGYKPIACGDRIDAEALRQSGADPTLPLDHINPVSFRVAAAPLAAAMIENKTVDIGSLRSGLAELQRRAGIVLVEGAGGWEVPVAPAYSMADIAVEFGLPVIVVVRNRLGALNHTVLTVRAIQARGLICRGLILNHVDDERDPASISNRLLLPQLLDVPLIADITHGDDSLDSTVLQSL